MSSRAPQQPHAGMTRWIWVWLLAFWVIISAAVIARAIYNNGVVPLILDTDDAMRLAVVRDFLAGQNWYDISQHRLNAPFGAQLHWSRLIDLPIAGLVLLFRPFVGEMAETFAVTIWPLLLLLVLLVLSTRLTLRIAGKGVVVPAIVLPVVSIAMMPEFAPGRIDHHNVQIILVTALAWAVIAGQDSMRAASVAGLLAATALAIGTESLPFVAGAILAFGLMWVAEAGKAAMMRAFGLTFGAATAIHLAIALPPQHWLQPACDAVSLPYLLAAVLVAAIFAALPQLPLAKLSMGHRLTAGAIAAAAALTVLVALFPHCMAGPYADLDPWIRENWVPRIAEAKPVWASIVSVPGVTIAIVVPLLAALVVIINRVRHSSGEERANWLILGLLLSLGLLVTLLQIRGGRLAAPLAVPAGAWLIVNARTHYLASRKLFDAARLVGSWLLFSGVFIAVAVTALLLPFGLVSNVPPTNKVSESGRKIDAGQACLLPDAFEVLPGGPAQSIMAPVDLGAHILAFSPHAVVGAPYHRNGEGMLATVRFFNGTADAALKIVRDRGIDLVVICPALPEMRGYDLENAESMATRLIDGHLPDWLKEVSTSDDTLQIFTVRP